MGTRNGDSAGRQSMPDWMAELSRFSRVAAVPRRKEGQFFSFWPRFFVRPLFECPCENHHATPVNIKSLEWMPGKMAGFFSSTVFGKERPRPSRESPITVASVIVPKLKRIRRPRRLFVLRSKRARGNSPNRAER